MKALVLNSTHQPLDLEERSTPEPDSGETLVRLKTAALNRRDYWITQGMYPGIKTPVILGSDGAGVTESGDEVIINPGFDWGDDQDAFSDSFAILGMPRDGTFAEEIAVPSSQVHAKPSHLNWEQAAALPLAGVTAYRALFSQGGLDSGDRVLITGIGGGVASFALQFAVAAGAEVGVTSSSSDKLESAKRLGATNGYNYKVEDWWKNAGEYDLIIDSAGGKGYDALLDVAKPGGRIVNYGSTAGPPPSLDLFKIFWKQVRIQGSTMGSPQDFSDMLDFVSKYKIEPVIEEVYSLEDGNTALDAMERSPQFGKFVLRIDS